MKRYKTYCTLLFHFYKERGAKSVVGIALSIRMLEAKAKTNSPFNKATAVKTLCSLWNIDLKDTIAFGDNYNDVEMLKTVGHGFLMGNAPDELKEIIKTHTYDNNNDGIYYALLEMNLI